ncbi:MAG: rhomboid family intramembrane serine protease [Bacteroidales bacterium]|nr:rhomboid family intramembrane serine protease [Bacteroidales bacterium]
MTLGLIIITVLISILCFYSEEWMGKLQFNPYQVYHRKQYYRLFTHAFVHADWIHLLINMYVLHSFGRAIESVFSELEMAGIIKSASFFYLLLYLGGLLFSPLVTLFKHKENILYNSVGASGAVSAVVFCVIFFVPMGKIQLYFLFPMPAIIFAIAYVIYSSIMSRRAKDNINHDAHLIGALFGFMFPIMVHPKLIYHFIHEIMNAF